MTHHRTNQSNALIEANKSLDLTPPKSTALETLEQEHGASQMKRAKHAASEATTGKSGKKKSKSSSEAGNKR